MSSRVGNVSSPPAILLLPETLKVDATRGPPKRKQGISYDEWRSLRDTQAATSFHSIRQLAGAPGRPVTGNMGDVEDSSTSFVFLWPVFCFRNIRIPNGARRQNAAAGLPERLSHF